jgi:hypothetical protein
MARPVCILCGKDPEVGSDGWRGLGPLFCLDHELAELSARGVLGFPTDPSQTRTPVERISSAIHGLAVTDVLVHGGDQVLVFRLNREELLLFFPHFLRVAAQFVPHTAAPRPMLAGLDRAVSALAAHSTTAIEGLNAVIAGSIPMTALQDGSVSPGSEATLPLGFEGDYLLDIENTALSWTKELAEAGLSLRWRDRTPRVSR